MPQPRPSCYRSGRATPKKKRQRMSLRSSDNIAATLSVRFGCEASQRSTSAQGRCLAGDRGGGHRVATILRRDVMATVSPSLMALSTEGKARRISRTEAVFIVNNYVSLNANVKISVASAWMHQARAPLWLTGTSGTRRAVSTSSRPRACRGASRWSVQFDVGELAPP